MSTLTYNNTRTVDNRTITLNNTQTEILSKDTTGHGATLTFGPHLIINQTGSSDEITSTSYSNDGIVNDGTINAEASYGDLVIDPVKFMNQGTINITNGDEVDFTGSSFINGTHGSVAIGTDSVVFIGGGNNPTSWSNAGKITMASDSQLYLDANFGGGSLNGITNNGGEIFIQAEFNGRGTSMKVGAGTHLGQVELDTTGTIKGATIHDTGSGISFQGGTLDGVTYDGKLDLSPDGSSVTVQDGITLNSLNGSGNGTVNLTGDQSTLLAQGNETLNNATINIGNNSDYSVLSNSDGATLTLGAGLTVDQVGQYAAIGGDPDGTTGDPGGAIVNDGTINANLAGGTFIIDPQNFTNNGTLSVSNGETVYVQPAGNFTNLSGSTLTGGTYTVGAGSTIELSPNQQIQTLNAEVTLNGIGSAIESYDTTTGMETQLDDTLSSIGASGALHVLDGRDFDDTNAVTDGGTLELGGGTFHAASLDVTGSGLAAGDGTFAENVQNDGTIVAEGGTLDITGNVTGGGSLLVGDNSTLEIGGTTNESVTLMGADATLKLDNPNGFTGSISGFQSGDKIDLVGQNAVAVTTNGDSITVTLAGGGTETFNLGTAAPGFTTVSDGNGGTEIVICFMPGTAIATPDGERAIEALAIGDKVMTHDGATAPVMWVGRQTVSTRFGSARRVLPIRIKAHALGENVPHRDLLVSPDHALLVDGVLIQAAALINGTTIIRETDVPEVFTYYHVELADHSLILAENVPAETFVDNVDRLNFDNWEEHLALYPEGCAIGEMEYPRAKAARQVPLATARRLAARAEAMSSMVLAAAA